MHPALSHPELDNKLHKTVSDCLHAVGGKIVSDSEKIVFFFFFSLNSFGSKSAQLQTLNDIKIEIAIEDQKKNMIWKILEVQFIWIGFAQESHI